MTALITIGNLTKDVQLKSTKIGISYALVNIAENIYKRDTKGIIAKDENGKYTTIQTLFYSVFVYNERALETVSKLKKGQAIKVFGKANIKIEKGSDGFNNQIIESITAYNVDIDPFNTLSESKVLEPEIA